MLGSLFSHKLELHRLASEFMLPWDYPPQKLNRSQGIMLQVSSVLRGILCGFSDGPSKMETHFPH